MIPVYHLNVKSAQIYAKKILGFKCCVEITHSGFVFTTGVCKGYYPEWGDCFTLNGKAGFALVKLIDIGVFSDDIIGEGVFMLQNDSPNGKTELIIPIFLYNAKAAEIFVEIENNVTSIKSSFEYQRNANREAKNLSEEFIQTPLMKKALSTGETKKSHFEEQKITANTDAKNKPAQPYTDVISKQEKPYTDIVNKPEKSSTGSISKPANIDLLTYGIQLNDIVYEKMIYSSQSGKQQIFFGKIASINYPIAIKISFCENSNEFNRVQREAMAISQLSHPNICKVYSTLLDTQNNELKNLIILEHCEGICLRKIIEQRNAVGKWFSEQEVINLLKQMIGAFAHIQSKGVVHSDIKPDNIVVSNSGVAKVIDFGMSLHSYVEVFETARTMKVGGTILYFSPLQIQAFLGYIQGLNPDCVVKHNPLKSDVFSLGLSFVHLTTLAPPVGLNNFDPALQGRLCNVISGIRYSEFIKGLLGQMLIIEENLRPDFITLNNLVSGLNQ